MLRSPSMTHPGARIVVHPEEAEAKASKLSPLKKHWFLIGIFVVITLANMAPYVGAKGICERLSVSCQREREAL